MSTNETNLPFMHPERQRYFEDYLPDTRHELGSVTVDGQEIIEFAQKYDPQGIHISNEFAKTGPFGGLIASGLHTMGFMMQLYTRHYLSDVSSMASPGMDNLRWYAPVRPDDTLTIVVHITGTRRSASKPDRGVVNTHVSITNQHDEEVMSVDVTNMIRCANAP